MMYKKLTLVSIKYAPVVMALTCSVKIMLLCLYGHMAYSSGDFIVRFINVLLDASITICVFFMGKAFGYCWKHQSLCRTALWGYLAYLFFLVFNIDSPVLIPISILYVALVLALAITYKECR